MVFKAFCSTLSFGNNFIYDGSSAEGFADVSGSSTLTGDYTTGTLTGDNETYLAVITSASDYYPFGAQMPTRNINPGDYRFGFNGQERDDEIMSIGNAYTASFWEYDPRLGRRWNIDPVDKPWISSYHAFSDSPISKIDPNGAEDGWVTDKETNTTTWDESVNNQEDFDNSDYDKSRYSYEGQDYQVSSGSLTVTTWQPMGDIENPNDPNSMAGPYVGLEYTSEQEQWSNWLQTYSSNWPDPTYGSGDLSEIGDSPIEMQDPNQAEFYYMSSVTSTTTKVPEKSYPQFEDLPQPGADNGRSRPVIFLAQTSLITRVNDTYVREVTVKWGMTVFPDGKVDYHPVTIVPEITEFHQKALENLPK